MSRLAVSAAFLRDGLNVRIAQRQPAFIGESDMDTVSDTGLKVTRVRHPLKMRLVEVARVERVTPHLTRVTCGSSG